MGSRPVINSSTSTPLSLQVYKTHAEFKAFRLNRTEQCRLESTRVFLSRQERNFHKDFRTSRVKLETNFIQRRLSVVESADNAGSLASSSSPWPASSTTPRTVSAMSHRRSSEIPSSAYSSRRGSVWSWPNAMSNRGRALHKRRQTYGGHSTFLAPSHTTHLGSGDSASVGKVSTDCDFCGKVSELAESYMSNKCAHHTDAMSRKEADDSCPKEVARAVGNEGDAPIHTNHPADSEEVEMAHRQVRIDSTPPRDENEAKEEKEKDCTVTNARHSFRRYSRLSASVGPSGITNKFQATGTASLGKALAQEGNKNDADPSIERSVSQSGSSVESVGKSERKVSIMEPPSKTVPSVPKTQASQTNLNRPKYPNDKVNAYAGIILEHSKQCTVDGADTSGSISATTDPYHERSTAVVDLRKRSEPFCSSDLIGRISQFLDQQSDFNKLFPLRNHEIRYPKNPRQDLIKASRTKEKHISKQKAIMINEVLEKLGLGNTNIITGSKRIFPNV